MASDLGTVHIGSATLDPGTQRLKQGDREIRLHPKDIAVLLELVAHAPVAVAREDLLARVWSGTIVGENALDQVITRLRRGLGDDARHPRCIETLPKRGYRLMVPIVRTTAVTIREKADNGAGESGVGNLPAELTSFVGRDAEITKLVDLLNSHRLVTLTRVARVGKTRVAAQLALEFPEGVWMVELAPVSDPAAVPDAIATALGITPQLGRSTIDDIAEALSGRRPSSSAI